MSNQTQYPTKLPNPANLAWKLANPTPMTVGGKSSSLKPNFSKLDDKFEHKNQDLNRSDQMYTGKLVVLH